MALNTPAHPAHILVEDDEPALRTLYENETLRERFGNNLHARIVRDFSEEEMLKKTIAVYLAA